MAVTLQELQKELKGINQQPVSIEGCFVNFISKTLGSPLGMVVIVFSVAATSLLFGYLGGTLGHVVSVNNKIYTPGWSAVTTPVTVIGVAEAM